MTTTSLKKEIIKKLDNTQDSGMLEIISKLLDKASLNASLKTVLTKRAIKSEENIRSGKVYTKNQALKRIKI